MRMLSVISVDDHEMISLGLGQVFSETEVIKGDVDKVAPENSPRCIDFFSVAAHFCPK